MKPAVDALSMYLMHRQVNTNIVGSFGTDLVTMPTGRFAVFAVIMIAKVKTGWGACLRMSSYGMGTDASEEPLAPDLR